METPKARIIDLLHERDIDPADRRRARRYACRLDAELKTSQAAVPCEIESMSSGGVSVRTEGELSPGELVTLSYASVLPGVDLGPQNFVVRRVSSSASPFRIAHLSLEGSPVEHSWFLRELKELELQAQETRKRREGVRVASRIEARLSAEGQEQSVVIVDLGTSGARLELSGPCPRQTELTLSFGPTQELAEVVTKVMPAGSASNGLLGVSFLEFSSGGPKEILDYMREAFATRRR